MAMIAAPSTAASVKISEATVESYDSITTCDQARAKAGAFVKAINIALHGRSYPLVRGVAKVADQKLNVAAIRVGEQLTVPDAQASKDKIITAKETACAPEISSFNILAGGSFAMFTDPETFNWTGNIAILTVLVIYVTMVYGPIVAILVEMFQARIYYCLWYPIAIATMSGSSVRCSSRTCLAPT